MNSSDSDYRFEGETDLKSNFIKDGIAALTAFAVRFYLQKKGRIARAYQDETLGLPPDPPPVVIKTGSFIMETIDSINEAGGNPNVYTDPDFGQLVGVRVIQNGANNDTENQNGIEVDVRLQKLEKDGWNDISPMVTIRSKENGSGKRDFVLKCVKRLIRKGTPPPGYREQWEDDGTEQIRIGQVIVRSGSNSKTFDANNGNIQVGFYNRLV
jgi:hypothetical protein